MSAVEVIEFGECWIPAEFPQGHGRGGSGKDEGQYISYWQVPWANFDALRPVPVNLDEDGTIREAVALLDREIKSLRKDRPDRDRKGR